jgi:membrane peptidoglycan carboxypeptidase
VKEETADVVTDVLRQVVERGTGTAAQVGRPAAGKTGTTNDSTDAWFVGYTASPRLTTAVWMGWAEEGKRPMDRVRGRSVSGGGIPAQIWQKFMRAATDGAPPGDFAAPRDLGEGNTLPQASGRDSSSSLPGDGGSLPSNGPATVPSGPGTTRSGSGGTSSTTRPPGGPSTTTKLPATTATTRRAAPSTTTASPTTKKA